MTRHKWEELKARHLDTPERRAAYAKVREELESEIAEYIGRLEAARREGADDEPES